MPKHPVILSIVGVLVVVGLVTTRNVVGAIVAGVAAYAILTIGVLVLGGLARPVPAPPAAGELRRVRLLYRCSICGTEVRMTAATHEDPDPPRHCQEDMELVAPTME
jgi:DNA-directed RNA polymerase subunit RPC12/RpoP